MRQYFTKEDVVENGAIVKAIRENAYPLNSKEDLHPLFDRIDDAKIVMLGAAKSQPEVLPQIDPEEPFNPDEQPDIKPDENPFIAPPEEFPYPGESKTIY